MKTCLTEWAGQRLSGKNLLNFIKSISWQSAALFKLFNDSTHPDVEECELLTEQEMMVLPVNPLKSKALVQFDCMFPSRAWPAQRRPVSKLSTQESTVTSPTPQTAAAHLSAVPAMKKAALHVKATASHKWTCWRCSVLSLASLFLPRSGCDSCASSSAAGPPHRASLRSAPPAVPSRALTPPPEPREGPVGALPPQREPTPQRRAVPVRIDPLTSVRGAQGARWEAAREDFDREPDWPRTCASLMRALTEIPALSPPHRRPTSPPSAVSSRPTSPTSPAALRASGGA